MQKMRIVPIGVILLTILVGCARSRSIYVPHTSEEYPANPEDAVVLLTAGDKLDAPYKEIGYLYASARSAHNYETVADLLRKKARKVGADAVIKVQYKQKQVIGINPMILSLQFHAAYGEGIAVRYVSQTERRVES